MAAIFPETFEGCIGPWGEDGEKGVRLSCSEAQISCGAAIRLPERLSFLNSCLQIHGLSRGEGAPHGPRGEQRYPWVDTGETVFFPSRIVLERRGPFPGISSSEGPSIRSSFSERGDTRGQIESLLCPITRHAWLLPFSSPRCPRGKNSMHSGQQAAVCSKS